MSVLLLSGFVYADGAVNDEPTAAWVQYVAGGVEVRAVVASTCPSVLIDGTSVPMSTRAVPTEAHPGRVCAAKVPVGTQRIQLDEAALPVPVNGNPQRIVVIGDTGCRVSAKHGLYQGCDNTSIWPFARIARSVAAFKPDLIICVGDYVYRESPCPDGDTGCAGTAYGRNQATWEADWLQPSRPMRLAAPLVFGRGNHESCARAGNGWFRYLDAQPYSGECRPLSPPWSVEAGSLRLVVLDTSDFKGMDKDKVVAHYAGQLDEAAGLLQGPGWLVTHRPFWGYGTEDGKYEQVLLTDVLQQAVKQSGLPEEVRLLVGGHLHLAQVLSFGEQRPPQLIVGNGGTQLIAATIPPQSINGLAIQDQFTLYQYGFVSMEAGAEGGWQLDFRDIEGRVLQGCIFDGAVVKCAGNNIN